jgi:hypothetical protein
MTCQPCPPRSGIVVTMLLPWTRISATAVIRRQRQTRRSSRRDEEDRPMLGMRERGTNRSTNTCTTSHDNYFIHRLLMYPSIQVVAHLLLTNPYFGPLPL